MTAIANSSARLTDGSVLYNKPEPLLYHSVKRIFLIAGHYGSGKTEFAVSYAIACAERAEQGQGQAPALIDLDIVNPYFRSREMEEMLSELGIPVYASMYKGEIAAEIPALGAEVRAPFEDKTRDVIVDLGGNDAGANVLNQFRKYLAPEETTLACVVNFNRFETTTPEKAAEHILSIEEKIGIKAGFLINNTHLLKETTEDTIKRGHALALETCAKLGKELFCTTYPANLVNPEHISEISPLFVVGMYLTKTWQNT